MKVSVLGAGSWGTALAVLLCENEHEVTLWSIDKQEVAMIDEKREQVEKLPGVRIPDRIAVTNDLEGSIAERDLLILAVPSIFVRSTSRMMAPYVEDGQIIDLFWNRDQRAIQETDGKYGRLLNGIAGDRLHSREAAEECVNDTYLACWNVIPPKQPDKFSAFISRITRNIALNRFDYLTAEKRNPKAVCSLEELAECVSGRDTAESELMEKEIERAISDFLWKQEEEKRNRKRED